MITPPPSWIVCAISFNIGDVIDRRSSSHERQVNRLVFPGQSLRPTLWRSQRSTRPDPTAIDARYPVSGSNRLERLRNKRWMGRRWLWHAQRNRCHQNYPRERRGGIWWRRRWFWFWQWEMRLQRWRILFQEIKEWCRWLNDWEFTEYNEKNCCRWWLTRISSHGEPMIVPWRLNRDVLVAHTWTLLRLVSPAMVIPFVHESRVYILSFPRSRYAIRVCSWQATSSDPWERLRKAADFSPKCAPSWAMFADSSIGLIPSKPASTGETRKM